MTTKPQISVFIPTYLDQNDHYLIASVNSVLNQDIPIEVIVISDRNKHPKFTDPRVRVIELKERTRFCPKNNLAALQASASSEYFLLLNDDTLMTRGCLKRMVDAARLYNNHALVGALSNCDNGPLWRSYLEFNVNGVKMAIPPQYSIGDMSPWLQELFEFNPFQKPFVFEVPRLFFYNVLVPRTAWDTIGPMDEKFQNSCDDFDYCIRAKRAGLKLIIEQSAFCFHFSGKTSGVTATSSERIADQRYIMEKHGTDYRIVE